MKAVKEKIRFALWLKPETMEKVRAASAQDDCGSLSEFIEKAVLAYLGYLSAGENTVFLPGAFLSTMKGIVAAIPVGAEDLVLSPKPPKRGRSIRLHPRPQPHQRRPPEQEV